MAPDEINWRPFLVFMSSFGLHGIFGAQKVFGQVWGKSGKIPSHPQKFVCSYTYIFVPSEHHSQVWSEQWCTQPGPAFSRYDRLLPIGPRAKWGSTNLRQGWIQTLRLGGGSVIISSQASLRVHCDKTMNDKVAAYCECCFPNCTNQYKIKVTS